MAFTRTITVWPSTEPGSRRALIFSTVCSSTHALIAMRDPSGSLAKSVSDASAPYSFLVALTNSSRKLYCRLANRRLAVRSVYGAHGSFSVCRSSLKPACITASLRFSRRRVFLSCDAESPLAPRYVMASAIEMDRGDTKMLSPGVIADNCL